MLKCRSSFNRLYFGLGRFDLCFQRLYVDAFGSTGAAEDALRVLHLAVRLRQARHYRILPRPKRPILGAEQVSEFRAGGDAIAAHAWR